MNETWWEERTAWRFLSFLLQSLFHLHLCNSLNYDFFRISYRVRGKKSLHFTDLPQETLIISKIICSLCNTETNINNQLALTLSRSPETDDFLCNHGFLQSYSYHFIGKCIIKYSFLLSKSRGSCCEVEVVSCKKLQHAIDFLWEAQMCVSLFCWKKYKLYL